jgi:hypothetical protein
MLNYIKLGNVLNVLIVKLIKTGITRTVILIGDYAIKIPNSRHDHKHFLSGCLANWTERQFSKNNSLSSEWGKKILPVYFCSWFGLFSIHPRIQIRTKPLSEKQKKYFSDVTTDIKPDNFGYYKGALVCVDFG